MLVKDCGSVLAVPRQGSTVRSPWGGITLLLNLLFIVCCTNYAHIDGGTLPDDAGDLPLLSTRDRSCLLGDRETQPLIDNVSKTPPPPPPPPQTDGQTDSCRYTGG